MWIRDSPYIDWLIDWLIDWFMYMSTLSACTPICQQRASDHTIDSSDPPRGCWGLNSGLWMSTVLLPLSHPPAPALLLFKTGFYYIQQAGAKPSSPPQFSDIHQVRVRVYRHASLCLAYNCVVASHIKDVPVGSLFKLWHYLSPNMWKVFFLSTFYLDPAYMTGVSPFHQCHSST